ncbi:MipA/OmpV family protein [Novosphingobium sp. KN65.2]|uniref:MipA/OmpV family protein n=1 Tax=Novosphingobium sp. KN65.2 TaxID=1478134 RepID=UPI0005DEDC4A|nr:MipA/OmpV family protein [Novosphingobium sp. KN65.2]CDO35732.1 MltA-interacting MipA [Novosphingobium sp. KN65.2]
MSISRSLALLATAAVLPATPAFADEAQDRDAMTRDRITVGVGAIYGPSYDGSDDYVVSPIPIVQGRVKGITISPRPAGLALDLIPDAPDARIGFALGPVATISRNRVNQIKDPVVRAAGKLDTAVELGASGGVSAYRLLNPYDSLSLSADVKWDVAGAYGGMTWAPSITYMTPVSKAALVTLALSAKHIDDDYADYYYSVSPTQSDASGLPQFQAKGGWESVSATMLVGYDLSGDLRDGGFALFSIASYSRMVNDSKDTPYTSLRGDADQWLLGLGVAYSF